MQGWQGEPVQLVGVPDLLPQIHQCEAQRLVGHCLWTSFMRVRSPRATEAVTELKRESMRVKGQEAAAPSFHGLKGPPQRREPESQVLVSVTALHLEQLTDKYHGGFLSSWPHF